MNEMELLRDHHDAQAPPSPGATASARARLTRHSLRPHHRPPLRPRLARLGRPARFVRRLRVRTPLLASVGVAVTAIAASVAVAMSGAGTPPGQRDRGAAREPGRTFLLSAAHTAAKAPAGTGTYWHVKRRDADTAGTGKRRPSMAGFTETWQRRDGRTWLSMYRIVDGRVERLDTAALRAAFQPFRVCDKELTYKQLVALPADPDQLRNRALELVRTNDDGPVPKEYEQNFLAGCITGLLGGVPAPPAVRAAAYQALAGMSNVRVTGPTTDPQGRPGIGVSLEGGDGSHGLVIDPRTSLVLSESHSGPLMPRTIVYIDVGWTDERPPTT